MSDARRLEVDGFQRADHPARFFVLSEMPAPVLATSPTELSSEPAHRLAGVPAKLSISLTDALDVR